MTHSPLYRASWLFAVFALVVGCATLGMREAPADATTQNLWGTAAPATPALSWDGKSVELGTRFTVTENSTATGVRFYRGPGNDGTHKGYLYRGNTKVAEVVFANETPGGWQEALFPTPVALTSGTAYTVSYLAPKGHYSNDSYTAYPKVSGVIKATAGTYRYGNGGVYPTPNVMDETYYADVIVSVGAVTPPPTTTTPAPTTTEAPPTTTTEPPTTTTDPSTTTPTPPPTTTPPPGNCPIPTPHVPDGPDGNGGCWPGPATTGPAVAPTQLYLPEPGGGPQVGPRYYFDAPITIENKVFNDDILVVSPGVVIKNSIINGTVEVYESGGLTVEDSEIHGGNADWSTIGGYNYDLVRSEVDGGQQSSICNGGCDWLDSYSHNPFEWPDRDTHQSGWATTGNQSGVPMSLVHSVASCDVPIGSIGGGCTSDVALQANFGPIANVTIDRNLLPTSRSGSFCLTGGYSETAPNPNAQLANHVSITNNVFGKGGNGKCGFYGTADSISTDASKGNVFTGNVFTDGTPVLPNQ